jgi:hypothetical protein
MRRTCRKNGSTESNKKKRQLPHPYTTQPAGIRTGSEQVGHPQRERRGKTKTCPARLGLEIDGSYASPTTSVGGCMHGCHRSSSAWASQNHILQDVQRTVAGYVHATASGEMPRHNRSRSALSCSFSPIDTTHLVPPFYASWSACRKSEGTSPVCVNQALKNWSALPSGRGLPDANASEHGSQRN